MMKILLFEDDLLVSELLKEICKKNNYIIEIHHNARNAVKHFKKMQPHLVLMDVMLEGISGIDAMKEIKKINSSIPIIAVTAMAMIGDKERLLQEGFDDYIAKPFDLKEFIDMVEKWSAKENSL